MPGPLSEEDRARIKAQLDEELKRIDAFEKKYGSLTSEKKKPAKALLPPKVEKPQGKSKIGSYGEDKQLNELENE